STPPPARDRDHVAPPVRYSSPPPQQTSNFAPLERIISPSLRSAQPPVGSLDGFKVNKRGKILDEEGEIIGELVDGDIMDCVRQRCNAYGEVLDDHGRVFGRVQLLEHSLDSPIMRVASPAPSPAPAVQQHHYFAPQLQQPPQRAPTPSGQHQPRRASTTSQQEVFTPAWQRQSQQTQPSLAWELRDHLATAQPQSHQAIAPTGYAGNAVAIELDAGEQETVGEKQEEMLPLFDHSEVFMPVPIVPPRSAKRSETPSPPVERHWAASQLIRPESPPPEKPAVPTGTQVPSRHVSAPPAPRHPQVTSQRPAASTKSFHASIYEQEENQPLAVKAIQTAVPAPQPEPQRQPAPVQIEQQQSARALSRSASDSSMSDIFKSYSKPSMSPVPEDGDVPNDIISHERSAALYSYKGEIPAADGPVSNAKSALSISRAAGVKSPPLPNFPRQAFTGGLPNGSPFAPMNSAPFSPAGSLSARGTPA
ncbi:hypothetical protein LTR53_018026, partial [Teratosphaeriaceae sp. CCFEE 6253]